jgi:hypothetical protein
VLYYIYGLTSISTNSLDLSEAQAKIGCLGFLLVGWNYMIIQLNPVIPLVTPLGNGMAIMVMKLSPDHHLTWIVIDDKTGAIFEWENPYVSGDKNITWGRTNPWRPSPIPEVERIISRISNDRNNKSEVRKVDRSKKRRNKR